MTNNKLYSAASGIIICILAACPLGCKESVMTNDNVGRETGPDLGRMEAVLRAFLASHANELEGMVADFDLFAGPRTQIDASTWMLGRWTITTTPRGFKASADRTIYESKAELELQILSVQVDRRDDEFSVADWSSHLKRMKRI